MTKKQRSMTVTVSPQTETKYGEIWNILQQNEPPQIRLSRSDVFAMIIQDYHRSITGARNPYLNLIHDSKRELE
jgi:hypothetical protein